MSDAGPSGDRAIAMRDALAHLQKGELEPALDALLDAWRTSKRHPAIAEAIDLLSATITQREKPIVAVGAKSARTAWDEAVQSKRSAVLERVLEAVVDSNDRYTMLDHLLALPPDPRLATAAKKWLEERPVGVSARAPFYGRVVELVERTGDVRLRPLLHAITQDRQIAVTLYGQQTWTALVEAAESLARKRIRELDREETQTLAAIAKLVRAPAVASDVAELFDRVYAAPGDDSPRAVLADLLQQRGDPRGEFIALQLSRHGKDRPASPEEKRLFQQWSRAWLGPLDSAFQKQGLVFERGFVTRGRYVGGLAGRRTIDAREWLTVTHLDVGPASQWGEGSASLLFSETARNLRHVTGMSPMDLEAVGAPRPWVTVGWQANFWRQFEEAAATSFPEARKLVVKCTHDGGFGVNADDVLALLDRWPKIVELELDADDPMLLVALREARDFERVVLEGPMGVVTLEGDYLEGEGESELLATVARRLDVTLRSSSAAPSR